MDLSFSAEHETLRAEVETQFELRSPQDAAVLCRGRQLVALDRFQPRLQVTVHFDEILRSPRGNPWLTYFGSRFAWSRPDAVRLVVIVIDMTVVRTAVADHLTAWMPKRLAPLRPHESARLESVRANEVTATPIATQKAFVSLKIPRILESHRTCPNTWLPRMVSPTK